ncbi:MAG TPA: bacillithiol biosynthesis deacetylase BshB1 [Puia sp.]|nr:bacillithiol biosynthesis deacetylase BshB1 [Puia sp.]
MKKIQILAIAVHPDDVELCCSGTLMMEKMHGKTIGVADLTRGELGTRGTPELRLKEAEVAGRIMDLDIRENLGMPDGFFQNNEENQRKIIRVIRQYQPEIVLASALEDRHPDHGRAGKLISDSCFLSGLRKISTKDTRGKEQDQWRPKYVFHFIQDRFYQPVFVYDITSVFDRKLEAIRSYSSQFHSTTYDKDEPQTYISGPEFIDSIIGRAQMLGKMIGVKYAEGFLSEKMIGVSNLDSFVQFDT